MELEPRKIPRQARARATVEAIVVATAQLLTERGFESVTTARVAERAGVSIGSLYQYFPNKQALAAAVIDYYGEKFAEAFIRSVEALPRRTLAESVDALIHAGFAAHPHERDLHRMLIELAPRVERADRTRAVSGRIAGFIAGLLAAHRAEMAADLEPADAALLVETVLETVAHRALEAHPAGIAGGKAIGQCRRLILAYLRTPAPA